jgi:hypothetical protein
MTFNSLETMLMPKSIHLAQASRSSSGIRVILGVREATEQLQIISESAKPIISMSLSDEAARGLHDWLEQLMRSDG